jgi:hypothetical protein
VKGFRILTVIVAFIIVVCAVVVQAHDEPVKTATERIEREKTRQKMERLSVESQDIWVVTPNDSGRANDSTLLVHSQYDRRGNLVEQWIYDGPDTTRTISLYDHKNGWLEEVSFQNDTLVDRTVFVYDHDGLIRRIQGYDNHGQLTDRLDYLRPAHEDVIHAEKRNASDSLVYAVLYSFEPGSEFKRLLEARQSKGDGSLMIRMRNRFDHELRAEKRVYGKNDSLSHSFDYTYTASGEFNRIFKRTPDGKVAISQSYEYRGDGLVAKMIEYNGFGVIKRTLYYSYRTYDTPR